MPSAPAENPGSEAKPAAAVVVAGWVAAELLAVAAMGFALGLAAAGIEWDAAAPAAEAESAPATVPASLGAFPLSVGEAALHSIDYQSPGGVGGGGDRSWFSAHSFSIC